MPYNELDELTIKIRDPEYQLVKLIEYIRVTAGPGHSFDIVVDPDMREHRKSFFIDGDGSFFIKEFTMNGKKVKIKDDKLLESYLQKIQ
jgi:hypothetical protein